MFEAEASVRPSSTGRTQAESPEPASPFSSPENDFASRHIGPDQAEQSQMLASLDFSSLDQLTEAVVPEQIRTQRKLNLPEPRSEYGLLAELRLIAQQNKILRSFIGTGYYDCVTPPVIQRNVLENPGWYTPYTPYQAEIAQGRLQALLNFQTMIMDLTGLEIANASLLDEGTAAAEAMAMCHGLSTGEKRNRFFVSELCHPQTMNVVKTRATPLGLEVVVGDHRAFQADESYFGVLVQYPATNGSIYDYRRFIEQVHAVGALAVVAADLLSLALLVPPGEFGADVAIGSAQRFGVPMGYGGPHAAFFATRDQFKRQMPGRLVGISKDAQGHPALRLSLQTREQHIRREKATSNICTAQALLATMASMYAVYHGPEGICRIATRVHGLTQVLAAGLRRIGHKTNAEPVFDTLQIALSSGTATDVLRRAVEAGINLRRFDEKTVGISLDETTTPKDVEDLWRVFQPANGRALVFGDLAGQESGLVEIPQRHSDYLTHAVFNSYQSETEMMRYLRRLELKDLSLADSMIPLGSCTMKLNAAAEMFPVTWPEFSKLHPFVPADQAKGYQRIFSDLENWLAEITGFAGVSLQPNAGSQGEYAGLLAIRHFHEQRSSGQRQVCLIPQSAHGTNPASAVMAGMKVVPVACDAQGNIDVADLRAKAEAHRSDLAALMITYPSTHGVFEEAIKEICQIIHANGGQVYMDGANLNAQVGLCRPAELGADVCHINLHKTFCIPHGGGGPGMGPICVAKHLVSYLPGKAVTSADPGVAGPVAAAPWGSASILLISWVYIALMGGPALRRATQVAILNANYVAMRLGLAFPVLYKGKQGFVAHECILDLRQYKSVTVEDVAKRLMDYGFHAPTISWPVPGTMMVEPTESEGKAELDRFCEAMLSIHAEIKLIESGRADRVHNVIKNAPHTAEAVISDKWDRPYPREQAAFPTAWTRQHKFWPPVGRIDNVYGDRNLVCSCVGMDAYLGG